MNEDEYARLHEHPDPDFIAENLEQRMQQAEKEQEARVRAAGLEEQLRRQNEISGGAHRGERAGGGQLRAPKALEYPAVPADLMYKGAGDERTTSDFIMEWECKEVAHIWLGPIP